MQSGRCAGGTLFRRGTYGNIPVSSRLQVVPVGGSNNFSGPGSASYCSRLLLLALDRLIPGRSLLESRRYIRLCQRRACLLAAGGQE
jgi:hypothetical protein